MIQSSLKGCSIASFRETSLSNSYTDRGMNKAKSPQIKLYTTREQSLNQASIRQIVAQSKVGELGSLILTNWSETVASERSRGFERRRRCSPIAQVLVWMAWQGSACAASHRLPGEVFTKPTPGAPHLDDSTGEHSRGTRT
jgi:hypothetical protein